MKVRTYHKNGKAVQFLGYSDIDASNAAKVVMGEVGDVGYFKPRLGTDEWIYDWIYKKEITDEDLMKALGR
jgi:hypothetical protein|tara:strand:+ start:32 stop:244 length:213 start_codon:yes stop_codon:yes gene_type:complete